MTAEPTPREVIARAMDPGYRPPRAYAAAHADAILAALAAAGFAVGKGWQPIETAPKKARVLAWRPSYRTVCAVYVDDFEPGRVVEPITGRIWIAQWWMPLPEPPAAETPT